MKKYLLSVVLLLSFSGLALAQVHHPVRHRRHHVVHHRVVHHHRVIHHR